jgi:ribosome maturation protein SDO1
MSEHMNLARLKKGSDTFEVVVDPDKAMLWRRNPAAIEFREVVSYPKVFSDAHKGLLVPEGRMKAVLGTADHLEAAKKVVKDGSIQLHQEYRAKLAEQKRWRIVDLIRTNAVNPRANTPYTPNAIEQAIQQAKIRIDEFRTPEEQLDDVLKLLRPLIPLKFVVKEIEVAVPAMHGGKAASALRGFGKVIREEWLSDGSWRAVFQMPGGLEMDFYDRLNKLTHGEATAKVLAVRG